jgi:CheY-like chemotaxis protein
MPQETLVVGRDANTRALLCHAFARHSLTAYAISDGAAALERCLRTTPAAVVAEQDLDGIDGLALLAAMRASPLLASVPFLLLSSDPDARARAAQQNGLALSWPVYARDPVSLLRFLWATAQSHPLSLDNFSGLSLVRALHSAQAAGQLFLRRAGPARFSEAQFDFSPNGLSCRVAHLQGKVALLRMVVWREVQAVWLRTPPTNHLPEEEISTDAFTEAAQYLGDVSSLYALLPPEDAPLELRRERRPPPNRLPGEVNTILTLCDAQPTLRGLIEEVPFRVLDSLRIIKRLFDLEILARPVPPPEPEPPPEEIVAPVITRKIVILNPAPHEAPSDPSARTWPPTLSPLTKAPEEAPTRPLRPVPSLAVLEASLEKALHEAEPSPPMPEPEEATSPREILRPVIVLREEEPAPPPAQEVSLPVLEDLKSLEDSDDRLPTVRVGKASPILRDPAAPLDPNSPHFDEMPTQRAIAIQPVRRLWRLWRKKEEDEAR